MNYDDLNGKIVILNDKNKINFLEKLSQTNKLVNIKILTLTEFKKKYFFDYGKEAINYTSKKYGIISEIAKIYIENLYYDFDKHKNNNDKIKFLSELKQELLDKGLLKENKLFRKYLEKKEIILYNLLYIDDFYINTFKKLNTTYINDKKGESKSKLYTLNNEEEEIEFVAAEIVEMIKRGIDINKIKLANVSEDYAFKIYKTFKLFNLEVNNLFNFKASSTGIVSEFKRKFNESVDLGLEFLTSEKKAEKEQIIIKKIINIINDYSFANSLEDVKDMIFSDIDNITLPSDKKNNAINIINFLEEDIKDDDYVFLIGFNQGKIPVNYKDEDFLNDEEKKSLGISTSVELNKKEINKVVNKIKSTRHLIVTYPKNSLTEELYISNAYSPDLFDEENQAIPLTSSNNYNKIVLSSMLDEFYKYGTTNDKLYTLYNHYNDFNYLSYNNKFSNITNSNIDNFYKDGLTLSYTSVDDFYHCAFKYYLKNVLKVEKYTTTFDTIIGNIFHFCLSKCFDNSFDFESCFSYSVNRETENYELSESEKFFLASLKEELKTVIDIIYKQNSYSSITESMQEKKIVVQINKQKQIIFKGFVDKILISKFNGEDVYFIVDYKTGNPTINLNNLTFGLDMQLPVYLYLIKKLNESKKIIVGGFYLQKILNNTSDEEEKIEKMKLDGYSLNNTDVISLIDNTYENSSVIKGMKLNKDGSFSRYAKVLSHGDMERIEALVDINIKKAAENIRNGKFDINPKKIDGNLIGCSFCKFKDICFMKNEDIVELKGKNFFEVGENNDKMDK